MATRGRIPHSAAVAMNTTPAQSITRKVYDGANATSAARVKSVTLTTLEKRHMVKTVHVPNLSHYESGCREHRECFGHMCLTQSGAVLPPQSMSMRDGPIVTEYLKASNLAFQGRNDEYVEQLKKTNYTKNGTMRSTMSTPVAGSCRLIATPMWEPGRQYIGISPNLASKLRVCRVEVSHDGVRDLVYTETTVKEGDWAIVVRPPSLSIRNVQPMRYVFWEFDCAGIHPEAFSAFHGDYDGDELHTIPVFEPASVAECELWDIPPSRDFAEGRKMYKDMTKDAEYDPESDNMCEFINYSTISAREMVEGVPDLVFGKVSRNKPEYVSGMNSRFLSRNTESNYIRQSIRGMNDICRQQLSQGALGDMTRVAKCISMCFFRPPCGGLHIATSTGSKMVCNDGIKDSGCATERAVMIFCAVAQQAALDSHRVQESDSTSFDFISDIFIGKPLGSGSEIGTHTLVIFSKSIENSNVDMTPLTWKYDTDADTVSLCNIPGLTKSHAPYIRGAYNVRVLKLCRDAGYDSQQICKHALNMVSNYYELSISDIELRDLSHAVSYQVPQSKHQVTTRDGVAYRSLSWVDKVLATDFTKIPRNLNLKSTPSTSTSAMFMNNFSVLKCREDSNPDV